MISVPLRSPLTCLVFLFGAVVCINAETLNAVFSGPPVAYEPQVLAVGKMADGEVLRTIFVEERAGVERVADLVRVPLFFAEGECASLDAIELQPEAIGASSTPVVWQADDVRLGPDGGISRLHLWFSIDLKPGEKKRYQLIRRVHHRNAAPPPAVQVETTAETLKIATDTGSVIFGTDGTLRSIAGAGGEWNFGPAGAFPRSVVTIPAAKGTPARRVSLDRETKDRTVNWATGPLFAKVRIRLGTAGEVSLEQDYRIPRHSREIVISRAVFPSMTAGVAVKENSFLEGTVLDSSGTTISRQTIPAGIRFSLRAEQAYTVTALSRPANSASLLAVPLVIGGGNGSFQIKEPAAFILKSLGGLQRGGEGEKETLYGFWSEVRLVPAATTDPVELWKIYRTHLQPLVAIVEEPGATVERLHKALLDIAWEMKPVGWRQDAGRALMAGDPARMKTLVPRNAAAKEANVETLVAGAVNSTASITKNGQRKLRDDEKGRAYGALDPYHITYTQSAAAAIAVLGNEPPPAVSAVNLAMATGVRQVGARTDADGYPYIDCFSRTLNMQLGPVLFGLTAGKTAGHEELAQFYRDLATAPSVQAIFGRAQRPYTGAAGSLDQTDFLYQSICDFWLRTTEILGHENLHLHPLAYARYTDCVDVMADLYHGVASRDKAGATGLARANFFRGQAHTHRWLGWSCAPFIRLLEDPAEKGQIGLTEAIHFADTMKGRWKNWPDLTFYILADVLTREGLARAAAPSLPQGPAKVNVHRIGDQVELRWDASNGAASYRVYRAEKAGGPYRWLNSPYVENALRPTTETHFTDQAAPSNADYIVTAVDAQGRESPWPEWP